MNDDVVFVDAQYADLHWTMARAVVMCLLVLPVVVLWFVVVNSLVRGARGLFGVIRP